MKSILMICVVAMLVSGCSWPMEYWTPEEQGAFIKKCKAAGLDYGIGDWGRIYCVKPK